jgi:alpha-galactosidase
LGSGIVLAFCRPNCLEKTAILCLGGLNAGSRYEITYRDTGERETLSGQELAAGIKVAIEDAPESVFIMYRELS